MTPNDQDHPDMSQGRGRKAKRKPDALVQVLIETLDMQRRAMDLACLHGTSELAQSIYRSLLQTCSHIEQAHHSTLRKTLRKT